MAKSSSFRLGFFKRALTIAHFQAKGTVPDEMEEFTRSRIAGQIISMANVRIWVEAESVGEPDLSLVIIGPNETESRGGKLL